MAMTGLVQPVFLLLSGPISTHWRAPEGHLAAGCTFEKEPRIRISQPRSDVLSSAEHVRKAAVRRDSRRPGYVSWRGAWHDPLQPRSSQEARRNRANRGRHRGTGCRAQGERALKLRCRLPLGGPPGPGAGPTCLKSSHFRTTRCTRPSGW